eukprot:3591141-Rhodomonas_salina.1
MSIVSCARTRHRMASRLFDVYYHMRSQNPDTAKSGGSKTAELYPSARSSQTRRSAAPLSGQACDRSSLVAQKRRQRWV